MQEISNVWWQENIGSYWGSLTRQSSPSAHSACGGSKVVSGGKLLHLAQQWERLGCPESNSGWLTVLLMVRDSGACSEQGHAGLAWWSPIMLGQLVEDLILSAWEKPVWLPSDAWVICRRQRWSANRWGWWAWEINIRIRLVYLKSLRKIWDESIYNSPYSPIYPSIPLSLSVIHSSIHISENNHWVFPASDLVFGDSVCFLDRHCLSRLDSGVQSENWYSLQVIRNRGSGSLSFLYNSKITSCLFLLRTGQNQKNKTK